MSKSPPRTWPEQPFTLITTTSHDTLAPSLPGSHHAVRVAQLMALTHNTIFRAFNAVHTQVTSIDPTNAKDVTDLLTFLSFAIAFLDNHHTCEELVFFPMVEAQAGMPGLMAKNVEQHRAFDDTLHALRDYVEQVQVGGVRLDAGALRAKIEDLAVPLGQHLRDEIPSLLALGVDEKVSEEVLKTCYKALHDEAEGTTDPFQIGPLVMGSQDNTLLLDGQRIQFPELPFALAPYLVDHIVSRKYAGAWRFCPSTFHGQPRETEFFKFDGSASVSATSQPGVSWLAMLTLLLALLLVLAVVFGKIPGLGLKF